METNTRRAVRYWDEQKLDWLISVVAFIVTIGGTACLPLIFPSEHPDGVCMVGGTILNALYIHIFVCPVFDFKWGRRLEMRLMASRIGRLRRRWRKLILRIRPLAEGHSPFRTPSIASDDLIRWRIEHAPEETKEFRRLVKLDEEILELEADLATRRT